jgi:hypothetical protein
MAGDYAFRVPDEERRIDAMAELALQEAKYLHERNLPMIVCSHWHGLEWAGGTGYRVHEKFIPKLLESGMIEPMGMRQLHERTKPTLA